MPQNLSSVQEIEHVSKNSAEACKLQSQSPGGIFLYLTPAIIICIQTLSESLSGAVDLNIEAEAQSFKRSTKLFVTFFTALFQHASRLAPECYIILLPSLRALFVSLQCQCFSCTARVGLRLGSSSSKCEGDPHHLAWCLAPTVNP